MTFFMTLFGILATILIAIYGFRWRVNYLFNKWSRELSKEWDVRPESRAAISREIRYQFIKGVKPDWYGLKAWYREFYWWICIKVDPSIPFRMQLKTELAAAFQKEVDQQILYGDGFGGVVTGIFNQDGIETANEIRKRKDWS